MLLQGLLDRVSRRGARAARVSQWARAPAMLTPSMHMATINPRTTTAATRVVSTVPAILRVWRSWRRRSNVSRSGARISHKRRRREARTESSYAAKLDAQAEELRRAQVEREALSKQVASLQAALEGECERGRWGATAAVDAAAAHIARPGCERKCY